MLTNRLSARGDRATRGAKRAMSSRSSSCRTRLPGWSPCCPSGPGGCQSSPPAGRSRCCKPKSRARRAAPAARSVPGGRDPSPTSARERTGTGRVRRVEPHRHLKNFLQVLLRVTRPPRSSTYKTTRFSTSSGSRLRSPTTVQLCCWTGAVLGVPSMADERERARFRVQTVSASRNPSSAPNRRLHQRRHPHSAEGSSTDPRPFPSC